MKQALLALSFTYALLVPPMAVAAPEDEVKAAFDRFVTAQNAHDLAAVHALLLDSPKFVWVTRGNVIWGTDAALQRFATLYQGIWKLTPGTPGPQVVMLTDSVAQLIAPVTFNIGPPDQPAPDTPFVLTQAWVHTDAGWKVGSLLPIPVPPAPPPVATK